MRYSLSHLWVDRSGVTAIEFSIWAPLLILLMLGGFDVARFTVASGRLTDVAGTIGEMLAVNTTGTVNYTDLQFYHDSAMVTFPQVLADAAQRGITWDNDLSITMSSVTFTATPNGCTTSCTYVPKVVWTSGSNKRSCTVTMTSSSDSSAPSAQTLPADVFGPTSLLVIDIAYTFRPLLAGHYLPISTITRSFYTPPRYVTNVAYQTISGDPGSSTVCP